MTATDFEKAQAMIDYLNRVGGNGRDYVGPTDDGQGIVSRRGGMLFETRAAKPPFEPAHIIDTDGDVLLELPNGRWQWVLLGGDRYEVDDTRPTFSADIVFYGRQDFGPHFRLVPEWPTTPDSKVRARLKVSGREVTLIHVDTDGLPWRTFGHQTLGYFANDELELLEVLRVGDAQ